MSAADDTSPVQIIQQQMEAFNAHDLDAFCAPCAAEIRVESADGQVLLDGDEEFRNWYGGHWSANPGLKSDLLDRISVGEWVIDENVVSGFADGSQDHNVIVFRVAGGLIRSMKILR